MKLMKMMGFAVFTALVGMAFLGVSSAMAELDPETVICSANVELCEEEGGTILPQGSIITATAKNSQAHPLELLGTINQICAESTIRTEITSPGGMGAPLKGQEPASGAGLTFTGCEPCTKITAKAQPGTLEMTGTDYTLTATGETTFEGCPFGVTCKFGGTVKLLASNDAALGGALFAAEKEELKLKEGSEFFCGSTGFWDAHYITKGHWLSTYSLG
jgi:hypothetical protein